MAKTNDRLRSSIAIAVVCIWGLSAIVGALTENYTELGIVTPVMMLVAAFLFGYHREEKSSQNGDYKKVDKTLSDW